MPAHNLHPMIGDRPRNAYGFKQSPLTELHFTGFRSNWQLFFLDYGCFQKEKGMDNHKASKWPLLTGVGRRNYQNLPSCISVLIITWHWQVCTFPKGWLAVGILYNLVTVCSFPLSSANSALPPLCLLQLPLVLQCKVPQQSVPKLQV